MSWTRWSDNQSNTLDESIDKLLVNNEQLSNGSAVYYENLNKSLFYDAHQTFSFNNQTITYNVINFTITSVTGDNSSTIRGFIVIYTFLNRIHYVINRNSDAKKILRLLLNYKNNNEIVAHNPIFTDDIFLWCVKRVFEQQNSFTLNNSNTNTKYLIINSILGMKGSTQDFNKLSASGSTVLNLVSTLSLVLESKLIEQTTLRLEYTNHSNVEMKLTNKGTVDIELNSYKGAHEDDNDIERTAKVMLLIYLEIIPTLIDLFERDQRENKWGIEEKNAFLTKIEIEINHRLSKMKTRFLEEQIKLNI